MGDKWEVPGCPELLRGWGGLGAVMGKGLGETRIWEPDRPWKAQLGIVLGTGAKASATRPPPQAPQGGLPQ